MRCLGTALALWLSLVVSVRAQVANHPPRHLGGHTFVLPMRLDPAFVTSRFAFRQGMALTRIENVPTFPGQPSRDVTLLGVAERLHASAAILPWLEVFSGAEGRVIVGTSPASVVLRGAAAELSWEAGMGFLLWRNERSGTVVTMRPKVRLMRAREVVPMRLLAAAATTSEAPTESEVRELLLSRRSATAGGLSLAVAQVIVPEFGVQIALDSRIGEAESAADLPDKVVHAQGLRAFLGGGVTATWTPHRRAPVAVLGEYRYGRAFAEGGTEIADLSESRHVAGIGVFYVGRAELTLGLFTSGVLSRVAGEDRGSLLVELVMQHFF